MSADSTFSITEAESTEEQGRAMIACIVSASRCFHQPGGENEKRIRVVKGLYGLVLYASEYWVESALSAFGQRVPRPREYLHMIQALVTELERKEWHTEVETHKPQSQLETDDPRLTVLDEYPLLQKHIRCAMASRTQDALEKLGNVAPGESAAPWFPQVAYDKPTVLMAFNISYRWYWS